MPKDRAVLPHGKSTILHCRLSVISKQQALEVILKAHYYTEVGY